MADEPVPNRRWIDRFQDQLDTRALEIASTALEAVKHVDRRSSENSNLLREDLKVMREERAQQHMSAEAKFSSIAKAQWTGAVSTILLLAGWVFYLATHQR